MTEGRIWGSGWTGTIRRAAAAAIGLILALALVALMTTSGRASQSVAVSAGQNSPTTATPPPSTNPPTTAAAGAANASTSTASAANGSTTGAPATSGTASAASRMPAPPAGAGSATTTEPAGPPAPTVATPPTTPPGPTPAAAPACPTEDCVTLDATDLMGPANHAASGLNQSVQPGFNEDGAAVGSLATSMFRGSPSVNFLGQYDWSAWDVAAAHGAATTLILSNLWVETQGAPPPTPWSNWPAYRSWVTSTVQKVLASRQRVNYWDVYNEPGWNDYYSAHDFSTETTNDLLEQFLVSYQAIKAVDPGAQIIGPSIGKWTLSPLPAGADNHEPDLGTFLRFAAAHHLQLAAVAWHDNGSSPATVLADAQATRSLMNSLPALGHPPMILDEFASSATQSIPGWDVGFLATATRAGFLYANRSCWNTCEGPELDGLLGSDGSSKTTEYYERAAYASMAGRMVATGGNDPDLPALGSFTAAGGRVTALIGRDAGCGTYAWCDARWGSTAAPARPLSVTVEVRVPWRSARPSISLSLIPFVPGLPDIGPRPVSAGRVTVAPAGPTGELVSFTIPAFSDGSAYSLTVTPGS
ncbi:MAG TPA: hypothetical protein VG435_20165 [Acidimicrobiales bacterium]|jgi:hypothetical protein|nr:hypothetical protein [Acidimicrobiales bacterium]